MEWIIISLILGLILLCAEVYIPGGILGTMGALSLFASLFLVFNAYGLVTGCYYLVGLVLLSGIGIYLTSKYVPRSRLARSIFLKSDEKGFHSTSEDLSPLLGKEGVALTYLRPAGKARLEERRIDVVTEGNLIEKGEKVRVIEVEGARVVVRKID